MKNNVTGLNIVLPSPLNLLGAYNSLAYLVARNKKAQNEQVRRKIYLWSLELQHPITLANADISQ